jgi:hypothetical protein
MSVAAVSSWIKISGISPENFSTFCFCGKVTTLVVAMVLLSH